MHAVVQHAISLSIHAGHTPYPDVQLGPSFEPFIAYLKEGHRMSQPESSPPTLYVPSLTHTTCLVHALVLSLQL